MNVLIIGFNRFDHLKTVFEAVLRCGFDSEYIFVAIDGPRSKKDVSEQKKIFEFLYLNELSEQQVFRATNNRGCRNGVIAAISWFFSKVPDGLIIEDDVELVADPRDYLQLVCSHLGDRKAFTISLHATRREFERDCQSVNELKIFESGVTRVWGWYTNSETWSLFVEFSEEHSILLFVRSLMVAGFHPRFILTLVRCRLGIFDTWDYEFNAFCVIQNIFCVAPNKWFIRNIGMDCGSHYGNGESEAHGPKGSWCIPRSLLINWSGDFVVAKREHMEESHIMMSEKWTDWLDPTLVVSIIKTVGKLILHRLGLVV